MLAVNPASLTRAAASRSLTRGLTAARASGVAHPWTSTGHSAPSGRTSASKPIKPGAVMNLNRYRIDPLTITSPYEPGDAEGRSVERERRRAERGWSPACDFVTENRKRRHKPFKRRKIDSKMAPWFRPAGSRRPRPSPAAARGPVGEAPRDVTAARRPSGRSSRPENPPQALEKPQNRLGPRSSQRGSDRRRGAPRRRPPRALSRRRRAT